VSLSDDVLNWVGNLYGVRSDLQEFPREIGALLWGAEDGKLIPDQLAESPNHNEIRLYDHDALCRVLKAAPGQYPQYLGDFHSHPRTATWIGQFPSPDDLFSTSVAADYWEIAHPLEFVERAPSIQVLLLAAFELAFVIERTPKRSKYAHLAEQKTDLNWREQQYKSLHQTIDRELGAIPPDAGKDDVRACVGAFVSQIQDILKGRVVLGFVECSQ